MSLFPTRDRNRHLIFAIYDKALLNPCDKMLRWINRNMKRKTAYVNCPVLRRHERTASVAGNKNPADMLIKSPSGNSRFVSEGCDLKIAVIAFELPITGQRTGGVSHFNDRLCSRLTSMGHDVTAFTVNAISNKPYEVESLKKGGRSKGRFKRYYLFPLYAMKFDFYNFDLVISSGDDWAMKRSRVPWIRIMHGSSLREFQNSRKIRRKLNLVILYMLEVISVYRSIATLHNSVDTSTLYPQRSQDKVVHLPVDTNLFRPRIQKESSPTILFVGGLDSRKRGRWLLSLFKDRIVKTMPSAKLWMVSELGPSIPNVTYFPHVDNTQLSELYALATVFCMPSTYEGFGLPYLEAMSSGTLVIATDNPGAREILRNGEFGLIVDDGQLDEVLLDALLQPGKYYKKVSAARKWACQHSWENIIEEYLRYANTHLGEGNK